MTRAETLSATKGDWDAMNKLHLAGTTLGLVACSLMLTIACGSSGTKRTGKTGGSSTTGGTSNGGGGGISNVAGTTGNGGTAPVVPTDCNGYAIPDGALIADWECSEDAGWAIGWWQDLSSIWPRGSYVYSDTTAGMGDCMPVFMGGLTTDAHTGTGAIFVDLKKPDQNWGAGLGVWWGSATQQCVDASAFTGISLWAKGSSFANKAQISFSTFKTTSIMNGDPAGSLPGQCLGSDGLGAGCKGYTAEITLTPDWTQFNLTWDMFIHNAADYPLDAPVMDTNEAKQLSSGPNIHLPSWFGEEQISLYVDDVQFIGGTAQAHTCTGAGGASAGGTSAGGTPAAGGYPACDGIGGAPPM